MIAPPHPQPPPPPKSPSGVDHKTYSPSYRYRYLIPLITFYQDCAMPNWFLLPYFCLCLNFPQVHKWSDGTEYNQPCPSPSNILTSGVKTSSSSDVDNMCSCPRTLTTMLVISLATVFSRCFVKRSSVSSEKIKIT